MLAITSRVTPLTDAYTQGCPPEGGFPSVESDDIVVPCNFQGAGNAHWHLSLVARGGEGDEHFGISIAERAFFRHYDSLTSGWWNSQSGSLQLGISASCDSRSFVMVFSLLLVIVNYCRQRGRCQGDGAKYLRQY